MVVLVDYRVQDYVKDSYRSTDIQLPLGWKKTVKSLTDLRNLLVNYHQGEFSDPVITFFNLEFCDE